MTDTAKTDLIQLATALQELESEKTNPASEQLDTLSPFEIATLMNREDHKVANAVSKVLPEIGHAIEAAAALRAGGRIIYIGAGTSGRLGVLDASEVPPTFSAPPDLVIGLIAGGDKAMFTAQEGVEDNAEQGAADLSAVHVSANDFVVGIAASGRAPYVLGAISKARAIGAKTAGISCNMKSALAPIGKPEAEAALIAADWDIKSAILTIETGLDVKGAAALIKAHGGHLRSAIAEA